MRQIILKSNMEITCRSHNLAHRLKSSFFSHFQRQYYSQEIKSMNLLGKSKLLKHFYVT